MVFDYLLYTTPIILVKTVISPKISPPILSLTAEPLKEIPILDKQISAENLQAGVIQSGITEGVSDSPYAMIIALASFVFIGASASAVYFIRQKRIIPNAGSDFEILD